MDDQDPIGQAIAATEPVQRVDLVEIPLTLAPSNRPAILALPADLTGEELLQLITWLAAPKDGLRDHLYALSQRTPLVVARSMPS